MWMAGANIAKISIFIIFNSEDKVHTSIHQTLCLSDHAEFLKYEDLNGKSFYLIPTMVTVKKLRSGNLKKNAPTSTGNQHNVTENRWRDGKNVEMITCRLRSQFQV